MTAEPSISSPLQLSTMASRDFSSLPPEMIREVLFSVSTSNANTLKRHYSQILDQTKCRQGPGWLGRSCLARLHAPHHVGSLYDRLLHYVRHLVIDIATSKLWHRSTHPRAIPIRPKRRRRRGRRADQTRTLTLQLLLQSQRKIEMLQTATCINGRHSPNDRHADMAMSFARRQH
jgi:hypothetical protein